MKDFLSKKTQLIQRLKTLSPSKKDPPLFFQNIFSLIQEEIPIRVLWFFPVDPRSAKRSDDCLQIWSGSNSQVEMGSIFLDHHLFPSVDALKNEAHGAIRGEVWWSNAHLMKHTFYQQVLKPQSLFFAYISLLFGADQTCIGYLVFWKEREKGHFSDQDCALLSDFLPTASLLFQEESNRTKSTSNPETQPTEARLLDRIEKISGIGEEELYSLIRRRAQPGILILNQSGNTLYLNHDAKSFLEGMTAKTRPLRSNTEKETLKRSEPNKPGSSNDRRKNDIGPPLPQIVYQLYTHFAKLVSLSDALAEAALPTVNRICIYDGRVYLLRALLLHPQDGTEGAVHFMILIEKVSQGVRVDQIDWTTKLTPRETEVVYLLLEGKTNKEIAVRIDIGEYTVKDHIKRIMKKLTVTTRAGIVAKVLQHHFPT